MIRHVDSFDVVILSEVIACMLGFDSSWRFFLPLRTFLGTVSVCLETLIPRRRFRPKSSSVARFGQYLGICRTTE